MNPVRENLCAKEYFVSRNNEFIDEDIWEMATTDAARSVGLDGVLGALAPGMIGGYGGIHLLRASVPASC